MACLGIGLCSPSGSSLSEMTDDEADVVEWLMRESRTFPDFKSNCH